MALGLLGHRRGKLFLNAACSSGVAASAWLGRGLWIVQSIARSASQPRCSATDRPSSAAMKAAAFLAVQTPPSSGGLQPFSKRREQLRRQYGRRGAVTDGRRGSTARRHCNAPAAARPSAAQSSSARPPPRRTLRQQPDHLVVPRQRAVSPPTVARLQLLQAEMSDHLRHACPHSLVAGILTRSIPAGNPRRPYDMSLAARERPSRLPALRAVHAHMHVRISSTR